MVWFGLVAGLAVLVATPTVWALSRPAPDVGTIPSHSVSTAQRIAHAAPALRSEGGAAAPTGQAVKVHSARLADQATGSLVPAPIRISIPRVGVHTAVVPVGIDSHSGTVEIPADVRSVGWYRFSSSPGGAGSSVLVGHVDSSAQGPGAFFRLRDLQPGDRIFIRFANGSSRVFRVTGRRSYEKAQLPSDVFAREGSPVLTLVTCGGSFDMISRHYADNIVVFAVPMSD
jgi:sortase (surface protein transpeptidase)